MLRIWTEAQLSLAFWLIPFGPVAAVLGVAHWQGWPVWSIVIMVFAITWPVRWYIWLFGDEHAIRR